MFQLLRKINKKYNEGKYEEVLLLFEEYLNIPGIGIDSETMFCYISSLEELGKIDEKSKLFQDYVEFHDYTVNYINNSIKYINLGEYEKTLDLLYKVLEKYPNYDAVYYHLGIVYLKIGDYKKAYCYLQKLLELSKNGFFIKNAERILEDIKDYYEFNSIIKIDYKYFVKQNFTLKPGIIVKLKDSKRHEENPYNRPVLIYKIIGDKVYGFPIKYKTNSQYYIIEHFYRHKFQLTVNLMSFELNDISTIECNINEEQLRFALVDLYYRYIKIYKEKELQNDIFVSDMEKLLKYTKEK